MTWHSALNYAIEAAIWSTTGTLTVRLLAGRPLRKVAHVIVRVADLLDTSKPGGLTDVLDAIDSQPDKQKAR